MATQNRPVSARIGGYKAEELISQIPTSIMPIKQAGQIQNNKADVSELDKVPAFYSDLQSL